MYDSRLWIHFYRSARSMLGRTKGQTCLLLGRSHSGCPIAFQINVIVNRESNNEIVACAFLIGSIALSLVGRHLRRLHSVCFQSTSFVAIARTSSRSRSADQSKYPTTCKRCKENDSCSPSASLPLLTLDSIATSNRNWADSKGAGDEFPFALTRSFTCGVQRE